MRPRTQQAGGESCASCRFFYPSTMMDYPLGFCQRHAPRVGPLRIPPRTGPSLLIETPYASYPVVAEDNYCGDYEVLP